MPSKKGITNKEGQKRRRSPRRCLKHLTVALVATALLGMGFWLLWNLAGATIFRIPSLTYWQALGAMLLSGALLRFSLFFGGRHRGHRSKHFAITGCPHTRYHTENGPGDIL